ncbi:MAG TPA: endonuclease/exonuclease/phosphatase family protein [Polyangiaceae bacterium]|nr:endonuclease/exonuclease/phosphatase family protein [Polyangiaceae bacterium]
MLVRLLRTLGLLVLIGCQTREPRQPEAGVPHVRVMTYNVNYGLAGDRDTVNAIASGDADIVVLQETNPEWEEAIRKRLSRRYPHMLFRHRDAAGGLGVLSRHPLHEKDYLEPVGEGWFPAWRVLVDSPLGTMQLLVVHLRPQLSESGSVVSGYFTTPPVREAEMEAYFKELDPKLPTIVAGDFNESGSGRAIRLLERNGYKNALPEYAGSAPTWRWQTSVGTITTQLDHLVYNDKLEPLEVRVLDQGRSDHLPVMGIFQRASDKPSD